MSISDSVISVKGTWSEPQITIGPRLTPLSTVPVQLRKVRQLRATAPVSGVVWFFVRTLVSLSYGSGLSLQESYAEEGIH